MTTYCSTAPTPRPASASGRRPCLAALAIMALSLFYVSAAAASGPTLIVPGTIAGISASGPRVVLITQTNRSGYCPLVLVKNVLTAHVDHLVPRNGISCRTDYTGNGGAFHYHGAEDPVGRGPLIALSGTRAAWIMTNQGNNSWEQVITQAIGQRRDHAVAGLDTAATDSAGFGPVRSGIVGDATELIYQQFTVASADPTCDPAVSITACAPAVYAPATVLSIPSNHVVSSSSIAATYAQRIDNGLVAALHLDNTAALFRLSDNTVLATIGIPSAPVVSTAVGGGWFAAATADGHLYVDSADGYSTGSWPIPTGAGPQLALSGGVAVFAAAHNIYAINVTTGQTRWIGHTPTGVVGLELTPAGATYAWNTHGHGYLQWVKAASLHHLVGTSP